jgi:hypothetical protein
LVNLLLNNNTTIIIIYLLANLSDQRTVKKLARVKKKKQTTYKQNTKQGNLYYLNINDNKNDRSVAITVTGRGGP